MGMDRRLFLTGACCAGAGFTAGFALNKPARAAQPAPAANGEEAAKLARERFLSHWNCTQAVLEALGPLTGMPPEAVTRITTPFAAGMWNGLTCGAVTGAMMAIGMRYGRVGEGDGAGTDEVKARLRKLTAAMAAKFGDLNCSALLGTDMATDEGIRQAAEKGVFKSKCPLLVEAATIEAAKLMA